MATLFKNANSPIWRARYIDANGRRISKTTGTTKKRDAERIAAGYEAQERDRKTKSAHLPAAFADVLNIAAREAASGTLTLTRAEELLRRLRRLADPKHREVTVAGWYEEWVNQQATYVADSSLRGYRNDLALIKAALGKKNADKALAELTADDLRKALAEAHTTAKAGSVIPARARKPAKDWCRRNANRLAGSSFLSRWPFENRTMRRLAMGVVGRPGSGTPSRRRRARPRAPLARAG